MGVWLRRKPWYFECSNYLVNSQSSDATGFVRALEDFSRFLKVITGRTQTLKAIRKRKQSFFVCLSAPQIQPLQKDLPEITAGADAVELRVDLLEDPRSPERLPSPEFVVEQLTALRQATPLPVVFTIRTKLQGGKFPDEAYSEARELYQTGLRLGCEFLSLIHI